MRTPSYFREDYSHKKNSIDLLEVVWCIEKFNENMTQQEFSTLLKETTSCYFRMYQEISTYPKAVQFAVWEHVASFLNSNVLPSCLIPNNPILWFNNIKWWFWIQNQKPTLNQVKDNELLDEDIFYHRSQQLWVESSFLSFKQRFVSIEQSETKTTKNHWKDTIQWEKAQQTEQEFLEFIKELWYKDSEQDIRVFLTKKYKKTLEEQEVETLITELLENELSYNSIAFLYEKHNASHTQKKSLLSHIYKHSWKLIAIVALGALVYGYNNVNIKELLKKNLQESRKTPDWKKPAWWAKVSSIRNLPNTLKYWDPTISLREIISDDSLSQQKRIQTTINMKDAIEKTFLEFSKNQEWNYNYTFENFLGKTIIERDVSNENKKVLLATTDSLFEHLRTVFLPNILKNHWVASRDKETAQQLQLKVGFTELWNQVEWINKNDVVYINLVQNNIESILETFWHEIQHSLYQDSRYLFSTEWLTELSNTLYNTVNKNTALWNTYYHESLNWVLLHTNEDFDMNVEYRVQWKSIEWNTKSLSTVDLSKKTFENSDNKISNRIFKEKLEEYPYHTFSPVFTAMTLPHQDYIYKLYVEEKIWYHDERRLFLGDILGRDLSKLPKNIEQDIWNMVKGYIQSDLFKISRIDTYKEQKEALDIFLENNPEYLWKNFSPDVLLNDYESLFDEILWYLMKLFEKKEFSITSIQLMICIILFIYIFRTGIVFDKNKNKNWVSTLQIKNSLFRENKFKNSYWMDNNLIFVQIWIMFVSFILRAVNLSWRVEKVWSSEDVMFLENIANILSILSILSIIIDIDFLRRFKKINKLTALDKLSYHELTTMKYYITQTLLASKKRPDILKLSYIEFASNKKQSNIARYIKEFEKNIVKKKIPLDRLIYDDQEIVEHSIDEPKVWRKINHKTTNSKNHVTLVSTEKFKKLTIIISDKLSRYKASSYDDSQIEELTSNTITRELNRNVYVDTIIQQLQTYLISIWYKKTLHVYIWDKKIITTPHNLAKKVAEGYKTDEKPFVYNAEKYIASRDIYSVDDELQHTKKAIKHTKWNLILLWFHNTNIPPKYKNVISLKDPELACLKPEHQNDNE